MLSSIMKKSCKLLQYDSLIAIPHDGKLMISPGFLLIQQSQNDVAHNVLSSKFVERSLIVTQYFREFVT